MFKGVVYKPSAARNSHQQKVASSSEQAGKPVDDQVNIMYGRIKEVVGGKRVKVTYYDDNKKDQDIQETVTVRSPGLEAIKTLYGGLQPGLPVRITFKGLPPPDPLRDEVTVDVIGGPEDDISKAEQDPEPEVLNIAAYMLFSGGMLG